jgi:hypothetical protein
MPTRTRKTPKKKSSKQPSVKRVTRSSVRASKEHDAAVNRNVAFLRALATNYFTGSDDRSKYEAWYWNKYADLLEKSNKTVFEMPADKEMRLPDEAIDMWFNGTL